MTNYNLSDVFGFWTLPIEARSAAFAELRAGSTIPFFREPEFEFYSTGPGYYALTRWDEVVEASRNPTLFRSEPTATMMSDMPAELYEIFDSIINMDGPRHTRLRQIVSRAFTPRQLTLLRHDIERIAENIIDDIAPQGTCDVVTDISSQIPLRVICNMMGISSSDYKFVIKHANTILVATEFDAMLQAGRELSGLMRELDELRVKNPQKDMTSVLVNAEVDGKRLTADELASFFVLLVVAANESTREAISWGIWLLSQYPEQRKALAENLDKLLAGAVEEIIRWASPVIYMRRTLAAPVEMSGQLLEKGSKVGLFYWSANRDERQFTNADVFNIYRSPNPHVAFGGPGPHFCLGAHLARLEITIILRKLLCQLPDLYASAEPIRLRSMFLNGIRRLPATFTPRPARATVL